MNSNSLTGNESPYSVLISPDDRKLSEEQLKEMRIDIENRLAEIELAMDDYEATVGTKSELLETLRQDALDELSELEG